MLTTKGIPSYSLNVSPFLFLRNLLMGEQPSCLKPVPNLFPYLPRPDWDDRKDLWDIFRRLWIVERAFQILFRFRSPILFDV